uniref:Ig-like domain-containing protein n=1 Tax=Knipowitschia caucasica TaxID=637954 RepID=A0AAV2K1J9_KNICA
MSAAAVRLVVVCAVMQGATGKQWTVTVPQRIMGVVGSCISVPCSFHVPDSFAAELKNCSGGAIWRKEKLYIYSGHLLGDLRLRNCTTVFNHFTKEQSGSYFFRLDCPKSTLKFTFEEGVHITVTTAPPSPPSLSAMSHVTSVPLGGLVRLRCVAMAPCPNLPPSLTWSAPESVRKESTRILQTPDGQMMVNSTLTFKAAMQHHNKTVTCSVSYPLSAGGSSEATTTSHTLSVLYGPQNTAAQLSASPVPEGSVVIFSCTSDANPSVSAYTWFSNTNGTVVQVGEGQTLPLQVKQTHSGLYECQAHSERGTQRSGPLVLEVTALSTGTCRRSTDWLFIVCGVFSGLYFLTVALLFHKYKGLSRRLTQVEKRGENTIYANLQTSCISSDYDSLQPQPQLKKTSPELANYENAAALRKASNKTR